MTTPIVQAVHATPVGALFEERPEDQAAALRDQGVQQAAEFQKLNNLTIPTNR